MPYLKKLASQVHLAPQGPKHYYQNCTIHESIHDSVGERSDSFKESKICLNRRQNHRIAN